MLLPVPFSLDNVQLLHLLPYTIPVLQSRFVSNDSRFPSRNSASSQSLIAEVLVVVAVVVQTLVAAEVVEEELNQVAGLDRL